MNLYKAAGASIQGRYALDTATQYTPIIDDGFIINTEKSTSVGFFSHYFSYMNYKFLN